MTSKRIWERSILNETRSALSKCCVRMLLTVRHTQSTATQGSHVMVSMLYDSRPASSSREVCLSLHRHCKSCLDSTDTGFAADTELTRYLALLLTFSRKKNWAYEISMMSVCLPACLCICGYPISIFKHRYEQCSIKSHPKLPHFNFLQSLVATRWACELGELGVTHNIFLK